MKCRRTVQLLVLVIIILIFGVIVSQLKSSSVNVVIFENGVEVVVEVIDTPEKQSKGLSGRPELGQNEGMLFIFPEPKQASFWMKDVEFPLDIIWIGEDLQIMDISINLPPCNTNSCPTYKPKESIKYVLEVNAGFAEKNSIKIGESVTIRV